MNDLIYRHAVLSLPRNKVRSLRTYEVIEETVNVTDIENLPSAQTEQRWIPCSERLPEEGELILLCFRAAKDTPHWSIQVGCLGSHDVEDYDFQKTGVIQVWYTDRFYWSFDKVVAWMPLPEPYKEEGGQE